MILHPNTPIAEQLQHALQQAVSDGVFSGAQAAWKIGNRPMKQIATGHTHYKLGSPVSQTTLFDIASLTKLFTATTAMRLVDQQKWTLDTTVWNSFTLERLLAHETGLPAWKPYFENIPTIKRGSDAAYEQIVSAVLNEPAQSTEPNNAVYSDIGFIGLGHMLSQMTATPLNKLLAQQVIAPLGLTHTSFGTQLSPTAQCNIAATESCPWRKKTLCGEVHDDNAWTMGGVAGHAGLFSTAEDMVLLGNAWLCAIKNGGVLSIQLAQQAIVKRPGGRGLGWDIKTPGTSTAGTSASEKTFGHLGFTGTSLWIDPTRDAIICLLSNRVHPTRNNNKIRAFRPYFHELFFSSLQPNVPL